MVDFAILTFFGVFLYSVVSMIKPLRPFRRRSRALITAILTLSIVSVLAVQADKHRLETLKVDDPAAYAKLMADREVERLQAEETRKAVQAAVKVKEEAEQVAADEEKRQAEAAEAEVKAAELAAASEATAIQACKDRFAACRSQAELFENFKGITEAMTTCRRAIMKSSRYGDPDLPWIAFSSYFPIENSAETGEISLIEKNARIPNAFGAMVRSQVKCVYDLRERRVDELLANTE